VKKPNQPRYPVEFSKYFTLCDLYIGAVLDINKFKFELIDADEYAYMYLEKHADEVRLTRLSVVAAASAEIHRDYSRSVWLLSANQMLQPESVLIVFF